jgi:hypothetical protein
MDGSFLARYEMNSTFTAASVTDAKPRMKPSTAKSVIRVSAVLPANAWPMREIPTP